MLREWKLRCPQNELTLAFPSLSGRISRHKDIVHALQKAGRGASLFDSEGKLKYTGLHSLRHFYASWCINPVDRGGQGLPRRSYRTG